MTERQPPQDLNAEQAVLAAMLNSQRAIDDVAPMLAAEDFYRPAHQIVYRAILAIHHAGGRPDPITVSGKLTDDELRQVGGQVRLFELYQGSLGEANADYYAEKVSAKATLRRVTETATRMYQIAHANLDVDEIDEVLDRIRADVDEATASYRNRGHEEGIDAEVLVEQALERYRQPKPPALSTGWNDVDQVLNGGLRPGQLMVVGARPGVGKSVIGINLAVQAAMSGKGVIFASLEMHRDEIADRVLAQLAGVELSNLTRHQLSPHEWTEVEKAAQKLRGVPLRIEDAPSLSVARLRSLARDQMRRPAGLGLLVADYMQLLNGADPRMPREQQVAQFSRSLKLLGKEVHAPVVALSQLNRMSEQRNDKKPSKADLRESGSIEQDADIIVLLWPDPSEEHQGEIAFMVEKHRQGPTGVVYLQWAPHYARARSLARFEHSGGLRAV